MSEYIVISRESLTDYISHAYSQGWNDGSTARLSDGEEVSLIDQRSCDFQQSKAIRIAWDLPTGWRPIAEAPKDGTWVLVAGPSGYTTTPWRVSVCRYYPEYRPHNPWQNHANNAFTDGGAEPTHFLPLIDPTEK